MANTQNLKCELRAQHIKGCIRILDFIIDQIKNSNFEKSTLSSFIRKYEIATLTMPDHVYHETAPWIAECRESIEEKDVAKIIAKINKDHRTGKMEKEISDILLMICEWWIKSTEDVFEGIQTQLLEMCTDRDEWVMLSL